MEYMKYDAIEQKILKMGQYTWLQYLRRKIHSLYPDSHQKWSHCEQINLPIILFERTGNEKEYEQALVTWIENMRRKALLLRLGYKTR